MLPKTQFSWECTLYRWTCSFLLCLKESASKHQTRSVVLRFLSNMGLQTSQHNSVSVLNGNVNAHWNSNQPLTSSDSVLCWYDESWTHIAALKERSWTRSYLTQATDTHPSFATGTVARRPIHSRLVERRIKPEADSPAIQLTFVRRWKEIQQQLKYKLHVSICK